MHMAHDDDICIDNYISFDSSLIPVRNAGARHVQVHLPLPALTKRIDINAGSRACVAAGAYDRRCARLSTAAPWQRAWQLRNAAEATAQSWLPARPFR